MVINNNNTLDHYATTLTSSPPSVSAANSTGSFRTLRSMATQPHGSRTSNLVSRSKPTSRLSPLSSEAWSLGQAMDHLDTVSTSSASMRRTEIGAESVAAQPPNERVKISRRIEPDIKENPKRRKLSSLERENSYMDVNTDAVLVTMSTSRPSTGRTMESPTFPLCQPITDFDVIADHYLSQLTPRYAPELFVGLDLPGSVPVNFRWINTQTAPEPFSHSVIIYGECHERGRTRSKPIMYRDLPSGEQQLLLTVPYELSYDALETRKDMKHGFFSEQEKGISVLLACGSEELSIEVMALAMTYLGLRTRWNVFNIADSIAMDPSVYEEWKQDLEYPDIGFINEYVASCKSTTSLRCVHVKYMSKGLKCQEYRRALKNKDRGE
ncbi:uncharacterized protein STEHIDRAFT_115658 [Stereum hirsutum FP-91666 SS1]|uniref:uncharacterized protein n=1 Tax=Stereum hirsutum (strain FP-91666) TaxID=721885 RepID=UPI0004449F93|nr:uncharacterized protein STEHIDRAFT_115658 [Stereum hirsutum FP-91666 SS1]EIM80815.1 hypothetical protein STEHIDRAFT_115658 [Stereum hirsutum FP-91666 SS1]